MTPAAAAHFAQRLAAPLVLEPGAVCRLRGGRIAVIDRGLRYRHVDAPGGAQYDGWGGRALFEDGGDVLSFWGVDGAASVDYNPDPHDLMERLA